MQNLTDYTIALRQEAYIDQIRTRFGLQDACSVSIPLPPGIDLSSGLPHVLLKALTISEKKTF
jgi:hypothetical protein